MRFSEGLKFRAFVGLLGRGGGSFATLLTTVLLARMLGAREFGEYMVTMTIVLTGVLLGTLGMGDTILRFVGVRLGEGDARAAWAVCARGLSWAFGGALVVGLILLASFRAIGSTIPGMPSGPWDAAMASLWLATTGFVAAMSSALRAFDRIALGTLAEITINRVALLIVLGVMHLCGVTSLTAVLGASAAVSAGVAAWAALMLWRVIPKDYRVAHCDVPSAKMIRFALPLLGSNVLFRIMTDATLWLASIYCLAEDVGCYGAAYRLWVVFSLPQVAVNAAIQGQIARKHAEGDVAGLEKLIRGATMMALWPTLAIAIVVCLAGGKLLGFLYGSTYEAGYPVLTILCLSQFLCAMIGSSEHLAAMCGREVAVLASTIVSTVASFSVAFVLLPQLGIVGGAYAAGLASIAFKLILSWYCHRRLGVKTWASFIPERGDVAPVGACKSPAV